MAKETGRFDRDEDLAMVQRHIDQGKEILEKQRALVARAERDGGDVEKARNTLRAFEETQRMHKEHEERLLRDRDTSRSA